MITLFNRKELLCTLSLAVQADARKRLQDAGIDYIIDSKDMGSGSSMRGDFSACRSAGMGRFGENTAVECEYRIFVHKNDYEKARYILNR